MDLEYTVDSYPKARVTWFFKSIGGAYEQINVPNDQRFSTHEHHDDSGRYILHIRRVSEANLGTFTCYANNSIGAGYAAIALTSKLMNYMSL